MEWVPRSMPKMMCAMASVDPIVEPGPLFAAGVPLAQRVVDGLLRVPHAADVDLRGLGRVALDGAGGVDAIIAPRVAGARRLLAQELTQLAGAERDRAQGGGRRRRCAGSQKGA